MRISFSEPGNFVMLKLVKFHDALFFNLVMIFFFVMCMLLIVLMNFVVGLFNKYNVKTIKNRESLVASLQKTHFPVLEFVWTIFPSLLIVNMALPTFSLLYLMDHLVNPMFTLKVIGNQWYWSYESNDFPWNNKSFAFDSFMLDQSQVKTGELRNLEVDQFFVIPCDTEIRLLVTSRDVLHSFAIPSLAIKVDAVPGRLNQVPLTVDVPGIYFGQCSELCGPNHAFMPIQLYAKH